MTTTPTTTIDMTGLPDSVIRSIQQLVITLRNGESKTNEPETRPPLRGRYAHLGYSIPKEVIDEARRECWANFPRDFPDVNVEEK